MLWGWAAREAQMSRWQMFRRVILPAWRGCLPMVAVALALRYQTFWASGSNTLLVFGEGAIVGVVGLFGVWFFSFSAKERENYDGKIRRKLGGKVKGIPA
jgi:hypothetical protein